MEDTYALELEKARNEITLLREEIEHLKVHIFKLDKKFHASLKENLDLHSDKAMLQKELKRVKDYDRSSETELRKFIKENIELRNELKQLNANKTRISNLQQNLAVHSKYCVCLEDVL